MQSDVFNNQSINLFLIYVFADIQFISDDVIKIKIFT